MKTLDFDDVYLSFQDWASVASCTPVKAMPIAGQPYLADWTLEVGEGGATGLHVELWAERVRAGVTTASSATVFQADAIAAGTYTNPVLAGGAVSPGGSIDLYSAAGFDGELFEGDQFSYWFKVVFDTNNGAIQEEFQTDVSYFPDNASVDAATGIWSVTGEYGPAPVSVTAWGPQEAWVNELHFDGANSWIEFAGRVYGTGVAEGPSSADIAGWRAVVLDASGNELSTTTLSSTSPLDGLRHDDVADNVGFYVLSGVTLPTVGGLKVVDAAGATRYAMCWGGNVPGCDVIYDSEPASGKSIAAIGTGTPANATFWQEWVVQNGTEGAVNVGQSLANAAPKDAAIAVTACRADGFDIAVLASDIDKPVSYAIAGENAPSGWSTSNAYTVSNLSQNTEYTYTLSARDALDSTTNNAASASAWTLLGEWELTWEALSAIEVQFTATIDNLGAGDTAWGLEGDSMVELGSTTLTGGSGPNTSLGTRTFVAQNGAEVLSEDVKTVTTAYTKAAEPGTAPIATADPNQGVFITFALDDADQADLDGRFPATRNGNPSDTEYALRAWLYCKDGTSAIVDWIPTNSLAASGAPAGEGTWQTLDAWKTDFDTAHWDYDITPTNIVFAFVARNHGDHWVETVATTNSSAHFELAVTTGDKTQDSDGSGGVTLSGVQLVNPFCNEITSLVLQYSDGTDWATATLLSVGDGTTNFVSGATASGIPVESGATNLVARWDALADLGHGDFPNVALRWIAETENASLADKPADAGTVNLYFAQPAVTNVVFAGDLQNGKAKYANTLPFTIMFDDAVSGLSAGAFTVVGGKAGNVAAVAPDAAGRSARWTVSVTPSDLEAASLDVAITAIDEGFAIDNFGNRSQAWTGNASVAYDGKKPTVQSVECTNVAASPGVFSNATLAVTIVFSEPVTGFEASDLTIDNGSVTAGSFSESQDHRSFALTITPAADGAVSITVPENACTDLAGNSNTASDSPALSRIYDTTAPTITFTKTPAAVTKEAKGSFTVAANDANRNKGGITLAYRFDSGNWTTSKKTTGFSWSPSKDGLKTGSHTLYVTATDSAGNQSSTNYTWIVDRELPGASFTGTPAGITTNTFASFTAQATDNYQTNGLELAWKLDTDEDFTPCGEKTTAPFSWTFSVLDLPHGDHTVSIKAKDKAGNESVVRTSTWTVDTTAPTVAFGDTPSAITNATSFTFSATATAGDDYADKGLTLFRKLNDGTWKDLEEKTADFTWSFPVDGFVEGTNTVYIKARDKAGNETASEDIQAYSWVKDTTPPVLALSGTPADDATTSAGDFAITIEATETNAPAGMALSWSVSGGTLAQPITGTATGAGPWTAQGSGLGEGAYTLAATVTDAAGNASQAATRQWTVTRAKPTVTITAPAQQPVKGDKATFTVTFGEAVHGFDQSDLTVLGGTVVSGSFKSVAATAPSVAYEVQVQATRPGTTVGLALPEHSGTNALGIGATAAAPVTCEVDYTAPVIGPLSVSPARVQTGTQVTYSFDVEEANLDDVSVEGVEKVEEVEEVAAGIVRYAFTTTAASTASFAVTATDAAGNTTRATLASPLVIDDAPPVLTWSGVPEGAANASAQFAATLVSIADDDPDVMFRWAVVACGESDALPAGWGDSAWAAWAGAVEGAAVSFNGLEGGSNYAFVVESRDSAGNGAATTNFWTQATASDPAAEGGAGVSAAVSGDVATFTVSWADPEIAFGEGSYFLRTNNLSVVSVDVVPGPSADGATNVTVAVTTAARTPGASVELVVPAGTLGLEEDSSQTASFTVPVLTYVGRSLSNPNILEWTLEGVASASKRDFQVFDPTGGVSVATIGNFTKTTSVESVEGDAASGWTIRVNDHAWDYCKKYYENRPAWTNDAAAWAAATFVNWRLVYVPAGITNAGPAEVNLALEAFGGNVSIGDQFVGAQNRGYINDGDVGTAVVLPVNLAEPVGSRIGPRSVNFKAFYRAVIENGQTNTVPLFQDAIPVSVRSLQWGPAANADNVVTQALVGILVQDTTTTAGPYDTIAWSVADAKGGISLDYSTASITDAGSSSIRNPRGPADTASIAEFAMMGAPVKYACEKPVPTISLAETVRSEEGVLRFKVESFTAFRELDPNGISFTWGAGLEKDQSAWSVVNRTEKGFEIVVPGVTGEGEVTVALAGGALWSQSTNKTALVNVNPSDAANASFAVDFAAPGIVSLAGSDPRQDGNPVFVMTLSEDASGVELGDFEIIVTNAVGAAAGTASITSFSRSGNVVTVGIHASSWESGATLALDYAGTLRDASGNEAATVASASVALPVDPATPEAVSLTVSAGEHGTVSPSGTRWFADEASASLEVVATPDAGFVFAGWSFDPAAPSAAISAATNAEGVVTASIAGLAGGTAITANFAAPGTVAVTVSCGANGTASWTGTANVTKGGSTNVLFTAAAGYRIDSVATNNISIAEAASNTTYLVSLANLQADTDVTATFEKIPDVAIIVTDGGATTTNNVVWNSDWTSPAFTAPAGQRIASLTVNGAAQPAAVGAASYTLQLFGVVEDTTVVVTYRDIYVPPVEEGFELSNLRWTGFDPATGVATFAAETSGEAPETITLLYRTSLGGANARAEGCAFSLDAGGATGSVTVPASLRGGPSLFLIGFSVEE